MSNLIKLTARINELSIKIKTLEDRLQADANAQSETSIWSQLSNLKATLKTNEKMLTLFAPAHTDDVH